jgi:uncharacterized protein
MTKEIKLLILLVTDDCNLRCRYCYARGGEKKEYMSWETAGKAVDYVAARSRSFKIQFSGGEPLLNFPLVKRVIEYVKMRWGSATFQLQTNGTLIDRAVAQELKNLRYADNMNLFWWRCYQVWRFQFLLGTLITRATPEMIAEREGFNSS